jgi:glycosyltransferase involved in cell wall biosynthesis
MSSESLVSIIIPTYNRAHLIGETIQSVVDQAYLSWELVIVDDGSADETEKIVRQFADTRIKYFRLSHSGSLAKIRNYGIKNSSGQYVALLDSDDLWLREKLTWQIDLLAQHPLATFVFGNVIFFGDGKLPALEFEELFVGNALLPVILHNRFIFRPSTLLFKRNIIDEIGWMDESIPLASEMDFFYRMSIHHTGIFTNKKLVKVRTHAQNTSRIEEPRFLSYSDSIRIVETLWRMKALTTKQYHIILKKYYYKMGHLALQYKKAEIAYACFLKYICISPFHLKGWIRLIQSISLTSISGYQTLMKKKIA